MLNLKDIVFIDGVIECRVVSVSRYGCGLLAPSTNEIIICDREDKTITKAKIEVSEKKLIYNNKRS